MSQLLTQKRSRTDAQKSNGNTQHLTDTENDEEDNDDEDDEEEDDEEEDDSSRVARAGYIQRLVLKNFMCHDHFELNFGPYTNFIIGRNGSGKSAVLTGILIGLGAKAFETSRGSSTKSLIKDGKSMARIYVELSNDGLNSFEPETYGRKIIVERKLTREGTNAYAIKSEKGTLILTKKKTLDDILRNFFIMVNNPLSFLSQDKAREFIASGTEQSRFEYFSKGTNIQLIILNYQEASRNILSLQSRLAAAKAFYDEAAQKYSEAERAYKKYRHSHTLRQQLERINGKIYWFNVQVLTRRLQKREAEKNAKALELQALENSSTEHARNIDQKEEQVKQVNEELDSAQLNLEQHNKVVNKAESAHEEALRKAQSVKAELVNHKTEIEEFLAQIKEHKKEIVAEQTKIDEANGGSKELMEQKLRVLQGRHEQLVAARDEILSKIHEMDEASPEMENLSRELDHQKNTVRGLRDKLAAFERLKNDRYAAFGLNISYLIRDIERETGWHQKPIGPIGCHVSVKEQYAKWTDLINAALQKALDSFVVSDEHDRRLLTQHMRNKKIFKNIIVRKFEKFDFSSKVGDHITVLDALDFHNEDVKYTLVDSTGIEDIVICDSVAQAEDVTRHSGVKQTFCLSDARSGIRLTRRDGQLSRDPIYYSRDLRKLAGKNPGESIRDGLNEAINREAQLQKARNALRQELHDKKKNLQMQLLDKKKHLSKINDQIFSVEQILSEEGDHGKIESLQAQIERCESQIKTREGMSFELLQNLKENRNHATKLKEAWVQEKSKKDEIVSQIERLERRIEDLNSSIAISKAEINDFGKRSAAIHEEMDKIQALIVKDTDKRTEMRALAEDRCAESEVTIEDTDTTESITAEFTSVQAAIEEAEKHNSKSFEDIQREVLESKAVKDKCEQSHLELENARVTLENDLNSRFENLNITIKEKLTRAKLSFEQCLALRGFKGKLDFDFSKKRVTTEVQTKDDKDTRTVLSLSGGEKSFTQIAFLLSIWKVMKPRVCGLDEFDVFMDSVNRTIAIRLLIHELRNSIAQSIFITPQDIAVVGDLKDSEDVKIHRIRAPRND